MDGSPECITGGRSGQLFFGAFSSLFARAAGFKTLLHNHCIFNKMCSQFKPGISHGSSNQRELLWISRSFMAKMYQSGYLRVLAG